MSKAKLFLSVSVIAMFAVGSAWASTPTGTGTDTVDRSHNVYTDTVLSGTDGYVNSGIAGVTYVNRMVGVAGGAAQEAEKHAAAAGAYAIAAAGSADAANNALKDKEDVKNKLKTTDTTTITDGNKDTLYPSVGKVQSMLEDKEDVTNKLKSTDTTAITNANRDTLYPSVGKVQSMLPNTSAMDNVLQNAFTNGGGIQQRYKEVASIGQIQELTTTKNINSPMPWVRRDYVNKGLEIVLEDEADTTTAKLNVKLGTSGPLEFDDNGTLKVNVYGGDMSDIPSGPNLGNYINMVPRADLTISALNSRVKVNQGSDNIKKIMAVNANGIVVPATVGPGLEVSDTDDVVALELVESANGNLGVVRKSKESYAGMLNIRDGVDTNSDGDYVPTTAQIRELQLEVAGVAGRVGWTQGAGANKVVTTNSDGTVSARPVGNNMVVNNGTLNVPDATASVPGVSVLGVIPSGADKSGTATIWVE